MKKLILFLLLLGAMVSCTPKYNSVVPTSPVSLEGNVKIDSTQEYYVATEGKYCETIYVISKATDEIVYKASNIPLEEYETVSNNNDVLRGFFIALSIICTVVVLTFKLFD